MWQLKLIKKSLYLVMFLLFALNLVQNKGYSMEYNKTIAIDLDCVLDEYIKYTDNIPPVRSGAREFIIKLAKDYKLILFTNRNPKQATEWLIQNNLNDYFDEVTNVKPIASIYIDDRAVNFQGDYEKTLKEIENFKVWWK